MIRRTEDLDLLSRLQRDFLPYCHKDELSVVALTAEALPVE